MVNSDVASPQGIIEELAHNRITDAQAQELFERKLSKAEHRGLVLFVLEKLAERIRQNQK